MRMLLNLLLAVMLSVTLVACHGDSQPTFVDNGGSDQGDNDDDDGDDKPPPEFTSASAANGSQPKTLRLNWTLDGEADHFTIEVNEGGAGYVPADVNFDSVADANDQIAGAAGNVEIPLALYFADLDSTLYQVVARDADGEELTRSDDIATLDIALDAMIGYVKSSNNNGFFFGMRVALSAHGRTLAVSTPFEMSAATGVNGDETDASTTDAGAVYVFHRDDAGAWAQQAYVKASNTGEHDGFGYGLSLSGDGNTLAVGADGEDSMATGIDGDQVNNLADSSGAVYVFTRDDTGTWTQQAYVKASNAEEFDGFGGATALSGDGNTLAVGAISEASNATGIDGDETDNSIPESGAVYVFTRDGTGTWTQQAYVKASNPGLFDGFGGVLSLSADGTTLAVSAYYESSNATGIDGDESNDDAYGAGAVYVFSHDDVSGWAQQAYIKASNAEGDDLFGSDLALSADGNMLAVGAYGEDSAATGIDGDETDNTAAESGAVYVFTRDEVSGWEQQAYIKAAQSHADYSFGYAVALSADGRTLAVGADGDSSAASGLNGDDTDTSLTDAGAVYVFTFSDTDGWSQQAYVKASNTGGGDLFGAAVALAADGGTLAVSAGFEAGSATGINGEPDNAQPFSGAVYLY